MNMKKKDYKRLGDYIQLVDIRNKDLKITNLLGVSISKEFISSIANTIGTDMRSYKIVCKGQFAYGPVTSRNGDKISIALLNEEEAIISQAYSVFEVIDVQKLLPEYLMMWFKRPKFDRYARYKSHGSAREIFDWEEMCNVYLPVPPIEQQRKIVSDYETLTHRIKLNEQMIQKLEDIAQTIYHKMFVDDIDSENLPEGWRVTKLENIANLIVSGTIPAYTENTPFWVLGQKCNFDGWIDISKARTHDPKKNCTMLKFGDILINSTGSGTLGRVGQIFFMPQNLTFDSNMTLVRAKDDYLIEYVGIYLKQQENYFVNISQGSTNQTRLYCSMIRPLEIVIPSIELLEEFSYKCRSLKKIEETCRKENIKLKELKSLILSKLV